jgi:hypothetical protein
MEKEEEILIKIKTLENEININIRKNATLAELKEKINQILNAPLANQRLIYQGKILQNNAEKIKHYKIGNESVLHLVMRKVTLSDDTNQNNNTNNNINNINHIQNNEENNSEHSAGTNNTGLGFIRLNHNTTRRLQRKNMHFDPSDCIETLYQNILVINHLLKLRNNFTISNFFQNKTIIPFNLSKKKFEVGEWVDVKDTTDNWLEGQIINKRTSNNKVQFLIHYSGWGGRWDEWIDQSSPRLSYFRTYTLQSIQSVLLSPNPTLVSDGNITNNEYNQKRPVDLFFYFNKISNIINEINKIIEKMNTYKKRENITNEEKDDIKEHKDKEGYLNMNNFIPFSFNELEIIQITSQMIPILDRCGRLMSDLSLLLSHTIFNPNLYPHLLLGHINNEISDSMSCTSGYSMLTNESNSILSGFTTNFMFRQDRDILNNLRPINRNNNNLSRPNVRDNNIINTGSSKSTALKNNISNNNTNNINIINNNTNNNTNNNNINNVSNSNNNANQFSRPHYFTNSSNSELPFIQRLIFNNNMHQNYINNLNLNNNQNLFDTFPKINLQIPPLLSPNQNTLVQQGGFNSLEEQNNIYLLNNHIFVDNSNSNINNMNYINVVNNNSVDRNQNQNDNISEDNYEPQYLNSNLNNTFNNNLKSLHLHLPRRKNSGTSCKTNKSADQMYTYNYKQFKMDKERNDLMKNLNKDTGYYDSISMKSDKVLPVKNKNFSYKSVSEVDEFGEYQQKNEDDEEDNKKKDNNTYTSRKSVESGYLKEFLEDDNSTGINYTNNNSSNNNININYQNNNFINNNK